MAGASSPSVPPSPSPALVLRRALLMAWRAHPRAMTGNLVATAVTGLAPVATAWLLREILDSLAASHDPGDNLAWLAAGLAVASGVQIVLPELSRYCGAQSGRAIERLASHDLYLAVGSLDGLSRLEDPHYQDQLNLAGNAGQQGAAQLVTTGSATLQAALTITGFIGALLVLSPVLAIIVMAAAAPGAYLELGLARRRAALLCAVSHEQRRKIFYAELLSSLEAAKEIRLYRLGPFFLNRMLGELRVIQRAAQQTDRRELVIYGLSGSLSAVIAGAGVCWAAFATVRGTLTVGDFTLLVATLMSISGALAMIMSSTAMAYQAVLTFRSYLEVVSAGPDLAKPVAPRSPGALRRGIEFDNVWFRYGPDKPWVLRGVSFFVPRGATVAIAGHNGAGKSTLIKLLCRFYDPVRGGIRWDGTDLRDVGIDQLRDRMSVVFQDFMCYELSAWDNIAIGDLGAAQDSAAQDSAAQDSAAQDTARVTAAARLAGIHETLTSLPGGYATLLTRMYSDRTDQENPRTGVLLSGGQWQRVALARALLRHDRDLVILDEPSSGLDAEAEYEIQCRLRAHHSESTAILISHRLSAARAADQIVVLADGTVTELGDHDELMARGGTYARMFSLQARGYAAGTVALQAGGQPNGGL
jgi:ATP-binding cassette, subfamily B, bacterial